MNAINATWQNGQIVPDRAVDWPEGCRLIVEPATNVESLSECDDDSIDSPEEIARRLALIDRIQPFEMTPEEEAAWTADRDAQKEFEKAQFFKYADELRQAWD